MKSLHDWQKSLAATAAIFSLVSTAFPALSIAHTSTSQGIQPFNTKQAPFQNLGEYQLAQAPDNCRRVGTDGDNLNVRSSPNGAIIGSLRNYTLVIVENTGTNGWVQISSPQPGYISAAYLKLCGQPVPPSKTESSSDNCRKVFVDGVLRVRQAATTNSPILGVLESGQRVTIKNRGQDGWVPISSPINGYIPSIVLSNCS